MTADDIAEALQAQLHEAAELPLEQQAEAIEAANTLAERRRQRLRAMQAGHGCTVSDDGQRYECY